MKNLIKAIAVTAEMYNQNLSEARIEMMVADLSEYREIDLLHSLAACRKECRFMPTIADIIDRLPGGHPSADEAWAMIPRDESESTVWTAEIAQAWGLVASTLDDGDRVAARMAFKAAYDRLVSKARAEKRQPVWTPSMGTNVAGREAALLEAVERGRLDKSHAAALLPQNIASDKLAENALLRAAIDSAHAATRPRALPAASDDMEANGALSGGRS